MATTNQKHKQSLNPFLQVAHLILPWLTPRELASLSSACTTLCHLSRSITAGRSSDASGSIEPLPIPFINAVDSHPYAYFLYTPTHTIPSLNPLRQPWPPNPYPNSQSNWDQLGLISDANSSTRTIPSSASLSSNPNPNPNPNSQFSQFFGFFSDAVGCDCGERCDEDDCVCFALRLSEVMSECGPGCGCGPSCGNRASQKGVSLRLKIVRDLNKGWGLFADEFILSGQFVCEYAGELLMTKEARERQKVYDELAKNGRFSSALLVVREHLPSGNACFRINIDATKIGNLGRFINHSCNGGNLSTVLIRNLGAVLPRLCFFAARDIEAGEELSFCYGDVTLRPDGVQCFCGSSNCLGLLPTEDT